MKLIQLVFALLAVAQPAPAEANAMVPPVQQEQQIALSAPLADWEQVLYTELCDSPVYAGELVSAIKSASSETDIAPEVLWSVAYTETHGRHWNAGGKVKRGSAGEVGLMQIKPFWAKALKREYGISVDLYSVPDNVRAGAYILSRGGDEVNRMLSYYNTGKQISGCGYQRKVCNYLGRLDDLADARPVLTAPTGVASVTQRFEAAAAGGSKPSAKSPAVLEESPQDKPAAEAAPAEAKKAEAAQKRQKDEAKDRAHYDSRSDVSWAE